MKKRLLSLTLIAALCLSLFPTGAAPALAADRGTVYVGGEALVGSEENPVYATTDESGEVAVQSNYTEQDSWQIKWDGSTLTLDGAKIKGGTSSGSLYATVGIYAFNNSGDVSLNIVLKGVNEIFESSDGIWVYSSFTNAGNATLAIEGEGSLNASGSSSGILVQSNSGNATLTIRNADVTAGNSSSSGDGVTVRAGESSNASLAVEGGSLTATGKSEYCAGIRYTFGSSSSGSGKPSLTVSDSTIVKASGSTGGITSNSSPVTPSGTGIVFDNGTGTVYGDVELQEDLEIDEGESLTLDDGASLDAGNHNVIVDGGTLDDGLAESLVGSVIYKVTKVELDKISLTLDVNESETLTATVEPTNATNKNVTWSSNNETVATVNNGLVTAITPGTATITVTTADGNHAATCTVTVTEKPVYSITASPAALNFGSIYDDQAAPAAQTVTITNTGNQSVTLSQPTADNYVIGTLSATTLAPNATATFTVQPKAGLVAGSYEENLTISGTGGTSASVALRFSVRERPYIPPTPPSVSEETIDAILDAEPGETVSVALEDGDTTLDAEVFETLAGQDITLEIALEGGVTWTVNGQDIPADANLDDLDLGVEMNSDGIPVDVVNSITGERDTVQMTLAHDGDFGFTMTLTAPLGAENSGYWANLYHYKVNGGEADREDPLGDDEADEQLTFETAARIDDNGNAALPLSHASQYAIVIDDHSHATIDLPFSDVSAGDWFYDPVCYVYAGGLMTGVSDSEFAPEATTTRAMIVSMLARMENVTSAADAGFTDVTASDWYATAVNWAAANGIVSGISDDTFAPNDPITREQLAAMLMNYAQWKGQDTSARADLSGYSDAPSTWASEAVQWAVAEGLLAGVTDDELQPQGQATRAQVAAIMQRFLEA